MTSKPDVKRRKTEGTENENSPFDPIPNELLVHILGFLSPRERAKIKRVSKRFNEWASQVDDDYIKATHVSRIAKNLVNLYYKAEVASLFDGENISFKYDHIDIHGEVERREIITENVCKLEANDFWLLPGDEVVADLFTILQSLDADEREKTSHDFIQCVLTEMELLEIKDINHPGIRQKIAELEITESTPDDFPAIYSPCFLLDPSFLKALLVAGYNLSDEYTLSKLFEVAEESNNRDIIATTLACYSTHTLDLTMVTEGSSEWMGNAVEKCREAFVLWEEPSFGSNDSFELLRTIDISEAFALELEPQKPFDSGDMKAIAMMYAYWDMQEKDPHENADNIPGIQIKDLFQQDDDEIDKNMWQHFLNKVAECREIISQARASQQALLQNEEERPRLAR